jgi:DNA helicase IV
MGLIAAPGRESAFVTELVNDDRVEVIATDPVTGQLIATKIHTCPTCRRGALVQRTGRYGPFYGCSTFPACKHTQNDLAV